MLVEIEGGRSISFDWKVSSERNFDFLSFVVLDADFNDTGISAAISGSIDWQTKSFEIPEGRHILGWVYLKDESLSSGSDTGWVDNVIIPTTTPAPNNFALPAIISLLLDSEPELPVLPDIDDLFPPQNALSSRGPVVVLASDAGDYIGQGQNYYYSPLNATISFSTGTQNSIEISVDGDSDPLSAGTENWIWTMLKGGPALTPSVYNNATRFPFNENNTNGFSFGGSGRGCNQLTAKFTIYEVKYNSSGTLEKLVADFEQHCENGETAFHGSIQYDLNLPETEIPPPGSVDINDFYPPIPELTTSGPVVRLESMSGDYIGQGNNYDYSLSNANIVFSVANDDGISISISGDSDPTTLGLESWTWQMTNGATRLTPGKYTNATRYPFNPALRNGFNFSGTGRGCNLLIARFSIYEVEYDSENNLSILIADFEQFCDGGSSALLGSIRYDSSLPAEERPPLETPDITNFYPVQPPLTNSGPVIRLESDLGDFIGQGKTYDYSPVNAGLDLSTNSDGGITITIEGDSDPSTPGTENWRWDMSAGGPLLIPGVYTNATRFPFNPDNFNGFNFSGTGRGCNQLNAKFTIYEVEYDSGNIPSKLIADFEQFCDAGASVLRGSIQFDSNFGAP